jgi:hypothetical protein
MLAIASGGLRQRIEAELLALERTGGETGQLAALTLAIDKDEKRGR